MCASQCGICRRTHLQSAYVREGTTSIHCGEGLPTKEVILVPLDTDTLKKESVPLHQIN